MNPHANAALDSEIKARESIADQERLRRLPPTDRIDRISVFETWLAANGWSSERPLDLTTRSWHRQGTTTSLRLKVGTYLRLGCWDKLSLYHGETAPVEVLPTLDPALICGIVSLFAAATDDAAPPKVCDWSYDHTQRIWNTACGAEHPAFPLGGPTENRHNFCGYCGGRTRVVPLKS